MSEKRYVNFDRLKALIISTAEEKDYSLNPDWEDFLHEFNELIEFKEIQSAKDLNTFCKQMRLAVFGIPSCQVDFDQLHDSVRKKIIIQIYPEQICQLKQFLAGLTDNTCWGPQTLDKANTNLRRWLSQQGLMNTVDLISLAGAEAILRNPFEKKVYKEWSENMAKTGLQAYLITLPDGEKWSPYKLEKHNRHLYLYLKRNSSLDEENLTRLLGEEALRRNPFHSRANKKIRNFKKEQSPDNLIQQILKEKNTTEERIQCLLAHAQIKDALLQKEGWELQMQRYYDGKLSDGEKEALLNALMEME